MNNLDLTETWQRLRLMADFQLPPVQGRQNAIDKITPSTPLPPWHRQRPAQLPCTNAINGVVFGIGHHDLLRQSQNGDASEPGAVSPDSVQGFGLSH